MRQNMKVEKMKQMRPAYLNAARILQQGRERALEGDQHYALKAYNQALDLLRTLPPERTRDVLLAHCYLAYYQTMALNDRQVAQQTAQKYLRLGISYARTTRDPLARAIAEECLSGLEIVL